MLQELQLSVDLYLEKTLRQNKPLQSFLKTSDAKAFRASIRDAIFAQAQWASQLVRSVNDEKLLVDDFNPMTEQQQAELARYLYNHLPPLSQYLSEKKVTRYFIKAFSWGVKAQYRRMGILVKADVQFTLTNQNYLAALKNRASYLINQSQIDETTRKRIISIIISGKQDALTTDELAKQLSDDFSEISDKRAFVIARTETNNVMSNGDLAAMKENGVTTNAWIPAGSDTCEICEGNADDGFIPVNEAFSSGDDSPPAHPNCILPGQEVAAARIDSKLSTRYDGEAVRLTLASGKTLSVTPNHLVASSSGWVAASNLKKGDNVLRTRGLIEHAASLVDPNVKPIKSAIENVTVSGNVVFRSVPPSTVDFNGDESFCENVDVVFSNSSLLNNANATVNKPFCQKIFGSRNIGVSFLTSLRALYQFFFGRFSTPNSSVCISCYGALLSSGHLGVCNSAGGGIVPNVNSGTLKAFSQRHSANPSKWSQLLDSLSGFIAVDKVVDVEMFSYSGHVYDLTVPFNFYAVNSIITHNCECYLEAGETDLENMSIWDGE